METDSLFTVISIYYEEYEVVISYEYVHDSEWY